VATFKLPFIFIYINLPLYPPNSDIRVTLTEVTYYSYGCRQPQTYVKPETTITVFDLLMISGVSLETCWEINTLRTGEADLLF